MIVYLDNSASTKVDEDVLKKMLPYFSDRYGNAGSMHQKGLEANNALAYARGKVAEMLNAKEEEIIFTGSGSESVNLAIKGFARQKKKGHLITTKIEHHSVLDCFEELEKEGFETTYVEVENNGVIDPNKIKEAIREETILISVMYANNEIGTIQPIKEIAEIAKEKKIIFHTDACQAGNSENLDVKNLGIDMMTLNGSKIHGPKGVGCLFKRKGIVIKPQILGGAQEFKLRAGTENIPTIVGFAKALEIAQKNKEVNNENITKLRNHLIDGLLKIPNTLLNGDREKRLPNNANITFLNIEGESILLMLDHYGICASSGSACTSKSLDPSHVILALGRPYEVAHGSIRFTLSKYTTKEEIDYVIEKMPAIVERLRKISPVHLSMEDIKNG